MGRKGHASLSLSLSRRERSSVKEGNLCLTANVIAGSPCKLMVADSFPLNTHPISVSYLRLANAPHFPHLLFSTNFLFASHPIRGVGFFFTLRPFLLFIFATCLIVVYMEGNVEDNDFPWYEGKLFLKNLLSIFSPQRIELESYI